MFERNKSKVLGPTILMLATIGAFFVAYPHRGNAAEPATPNPEGSRDTCLQPKSALNDETCAWTLFKGKRSRFRFAYPAAVFAPLMATSQSESTTLQDPKGEMVVTAWAESVSHKLKPREAMAADLYNIGLQDIVRQDAGDSDYTVFGTHESRSLLKRRIFLNSAPRISATICITWPKSAGEEWVALAFKIAASLQLAQDDDQGTLGPRVESASASYRCRGL